MLLCEQEMHSPGISGPGCRQKTNQKKIRGSAKLQYSSDESDPADSDMLVTSVWPPHDVVHILLSYFRAYQWRSPRGVMGLQVVLW